MADEAPAIEELNLGQSQPGDIALLLGRGAMWPTAWDPSLTVDDHALLLASRLTRRGDDSRIWISGQQPGPCSVARLAALPWDTEYFSMPMGAIELAACGAASMTAAVVAAAVSAARDTGLQHLRCSVDAGDHLTRRTLQRHGFRVEWSYTRIICDTTRLDHDAGGLPRTVEVVPTTSDHLEALLAIVEQLPPYSWLELDESLPADARCAYVGTRLVNCVESDLADVVQTLLIRGRPVGFNASSIRGHGPLVPSETRFSWELDTFVSPAAPPGIGVSFERAVVHNLRPHARFLIGRVRLEGVAMFRATERAGFRSDGGEHVLTWRQGRRL